MAQKRTMLSSICLSTGSALIQVSIKSVSPQMKQNLHLFPHAPLKELIDNVPVYSPARMFLITCIVLLHNGDICSVTLLASSQEANKPTGIHQAE